MFDGQLVTKRFVPRVWLTRALAAALAAWLLLTAAAADEWRWADVSRIVAVADVHGAYEPLVALLQGAGMLGASLEWTGGDAHLVSLGDLLDRGPESRAVMDLLMRLQREAAERGGAVHVLLGNHELMNLLGDLRYVSREEYAAFVEDEPQAVRASAYARFLAEQPEGMAESEAGEAFERRYPPGYFGHRLAFRPNGRYGEWLLSLPAVIVINDTAFVHGGLPGMMSRTSAAEINRRIRDTLHRYLAVRAELASRGVLPEHDMERDEELARAALGAAGDNSGEMPALLEELLVLAEAEELGPEGPLWYRGAIYCNPLVEAAVLEAALGRLGADRVVVGHTVTDDRRVRSLYDGRLLMLDTGMLADYYSGRPAALAIEVDGTGVRYLAPPEGAQPEPGGVEAFGMTESQILDALSAGSVDVDGSLPESIAARAVDVRHQGNEIRAVFHRQDRRRGANFELAAHALDRLLGLHLVPPTVARELGGETGALQLRYPDAISESDRTARRLPLGTWCRMEPQLELMYAFDILMYNGDREADNILYRRDLSALKLIDHGRAFGTERRVALADGALSLPAPLRAALAALDQEAVEAALGEWLDGRQVRALLARRDALLEQTATR